jgi:hypothetical protein
MIRQAFPRAVKLHALAAVIGSTSTERIEAAGFRVIPDPTRTLPTHYRLIHPLGADGFNDQNLSRLAEAFSDSKMEVE